MNYKENKIKDIARLFDLNMKKTRIEFEISGSPERSDFRCVIEDENGVLFLIEAFDCSKSRTKEKIAETIDILHTNGLTKTIPYLRSREGYFILKNSGASWQMSRFLPSEPIRRPDYLKVSSIGEELASFLYDLKKISGEVLEAGKDFSFFSIKNYIVSMMTMIERNNPEIMDKIKPVYNFLDDCFFKRHDSLSKGFCHGDIHPMNVIWKKNRITAVIDWEFMGLKPEIYDLANLLGCMGIEDPSSLGGDLANQMIGRLKKNQVYTPESWIILPEFVLSIRFGWLSEWLRKKDKEMIRLETDFMNLLVNYNNDIKSHWDAIRGDN